MYKLLILFITINTLLSCGRKGCVNIEANNYNPKANKDDGSCQFTANHVFWYDQNTSQNLVNDGATKLYLSIDGIVQDSISPAVSWGGRPTCGDLGAIEMEKDLGNSDIKEYSYLFYDQRGVLYWQGKVVLGGGQCTALQLIF